MTNYVSPSTISEIDAQWSTRLLPQDVITG
jgi:hypothetical protein